MRWYIPLTEIPLVTAGYFTSLRYIWCSWEFSIPEIPPSYSWIFPLTEIPPGTAGDFPSLRYPLPTHGYSPD